jgi:hypothetical protein
MEFLLLRPEDVARGDVERWRALTDAAIDSNPYFDPRWLMPALAATNSSQIRFAVVTAADEWLAFFPFLSADRSMIGMHAATTEAGLMLAAMARRHPLVSRESSVAALGTLMQGMRDRGRFSSVRFGDVPAGDLWRALCEAAEHMRAPLSIRGVLEMPWTGNQNQLLKGEESQRLDPDFALPHWSSSSNKRVARYARAIEREVGPLALTHGLTPELIEEFLQLQAAGWKGNIEGGGSAYLAIGAESRFRDMANGFGATGDAKIFRLGTEQVAVHMYMTVRAGGGMFGLADAYDERFSRQHGGTLGRIATQRAASTMAQFFDPCLHPGNAEASRQYDARRKHRDVLVSIGRVRGMGVNAARGARAVRARLRTGRRSR